jgi:hypothetical protein
MSNLRSFFSEMHKTYLVACVPRPSALGLVVFPYMWFVAIKRSIRGALLFGVFRNPTRGWLLMYGLSGFVAGLLWLPWSVRKFPAAVGTFIKLVRELDSKKSEKKSDTQRPE